jgi:hypothetical protein
LVNRVPVRATILQRADGELEGRAGDVDVVILDADRVDAELVGNEVYRVETVLQLGDGCFVQLKVFDTYK